MASKIELYREVLEIEPNSKAFFPLARQLAEDGRVDEAIEILGRGIGFHPDHLEAKFLLIDILTRQGREGEAEAVFTDVGTLLARYPSVWLLWSRAAAARSRDPSLAMLFLGQYFQNESLTWTEVLERGLRSLSQAASGPAIREIPRPTPAEPTPEPEFPTCRPEPDAGAPPLRGVQEVMELAAEMLPEPEASAPRAAAKPGKARETGVRTRTMASLLACQGDMAGALAIYNELIEAAAPGPERDELMAQVAALAPNSGGASPAGPAPDDAPVPTAPAQKGASKLISLLEALAGRLEARSGT
jgi:tetratricopeptide (TPR) repeat protein